MTDVTRLLRRMREGDRAALEELMPLVYGELRRIAGAVMRRQPPGATLQPTALVNEAYLKLFQQTKPQVADRAHFLALMSRVMRQVLVDYARARATAKRGGKSTRSGDVQLAALPRSEPIDVLRVHRALELLTQEDSALAELVELRYFGGLTPVEIAEVLRRSIHIVRHDLRFAQAWLRRELSR